MWSTTLAPVAFTFCSRSSHETLNWPSGVSYVSSVKVRGLPWRSPPAHCVGLPMSWVLISSDTIDDVWSGDGPVGHMYGTLSR